jgi:hypothetical protein
MNQGNNNNGKMVLFVCLFVVFFCCFFVLFLVAFLPPKTVP